MPDPDWLPSLIEFEGEWNAYIDRVYEVYLSDFVRTKVSYKNSRVAVRREPESNGKGSGFWHCVSEGHDEDRRVPDLARCARVPWIRAIIENSEHELIDVWENSRRGNTNILLWFNEEFLVVLSKRDGYVLLITAYSTDYERRRARLRAERDAYIERESHKK